MVDGDGEERREEEEEEEKKKAERNHRGRPRGQIIGSDNDDSPSNHAPEQPTSSQFGFIDAGSGFITIVLFSGRVLRKANSSSRVAECPALFALDDLFYCCIQSVALRLTTSSQWRRSRASNRYV